MINPTLKVLRRQLIEARSELMRIKGFKRGGTADFKHDADVRERDRKRKITRTTIRLLKRRIVREEIFEVRMESERQALPAGWEAMDRRDEAWELMGLPRVYG